MTPDDLQAALDAATATLATRELRYWEGEYSPEPDEYAATHARTAAQLRDPAGPLAPLLAVLAQTERERDSLAAAVVEYERAIAVRLVTAPKRKRARKRARNGPRPAYPSDALAASSERGVR